MEKTSQNTEHRTQDTESAAGVQPAVPRCDNCRFWDRFKNPTTDGYCRFNVPVIMSLPVIQSTYEPHQQDLSAVFSGNWPVTIANDWCGKFEPGRDGIGYVAKFEGSAGPVTEIINNQ